MENKKNLHIKMKGVIIGNDLPFIFGSPDSMESLRRALFMAKSINDIYLNLDIPFIFKTSFDKINRASVKSFRGVGIKREKRDENY